MKSRRCKRTSAGVRSWIEGRCRRARGRAGYSLIEFLVIASMLSVLLTSLGVTLHWVSQLTLKLRVSLTDSAAWTRLSVSVREDAHGAVAWSLTEPNEGGAVLRLSGSQREVVYRSSGSRLVRERWRGDEQLGREVFDFPRGTRITWAAIDADSPEVRLEVVPPREGMRSRWEAAVPLRLSAVLAMRGHIP